MNRQPGETALVLSGGGAHGAFGVGVIKALFSGRSPGTGYQPLTATILTGTSVGAFNAAIIAGYRGPALDAAHRLETIWTEKIASAPGRCGNGIFRVRGSFEEYVEPDCLRSPTAALGRFAQDSLSIGRYFLNRTANFLASSVPVDSRALSLVNIADFVDMSPLHRLLREVLDPAAVLGSRQRLKIVATNWVTGVPVEFTNVDFAGDRGLMAIMASTAIPGVFPPVMVEDALCADGGVVQNTPLNPAIQMGATEMHVVYLNPNPQMIPLQGQPNTIDTLLRVYFLMLASKLEEDISTAQWINDGIRVLEHYASSGQMDASGAAKVARVAKQILAEDGSIHHRRLTIHRYFPQKVRGGSFGFFDFGRHNILEMVAAGEHVALNHNCTESGCVLD